MLSSLGHLTCQSRMLALAHPVGCDNIAECQPGTSGLEMTVMRNDGAWDSDGPLGCWTASGSLLGLLGRGR